VTSEPRSRMDPVFFKPIVSSLFFIGASIICGVWAASPGTRQHINEVAGVFAPLPILTVVVALSGNGGAVLHTRASACPRSNRQPKAVGFRRRPQPQAWSDS
jgi:hypothetical protein